MDGSEAKEVMQPKHLITKVGQVFLILTLALLIPARGVLADTPAINEQAADDIKSIYGDTPLYSNVVGACSALGSSAPVASTGGANIELSYQDAARSNRKVDATVWLPSDTTPHPLVMFAPGRDVNSKADGIYKRYLAAIAAQGYVVVGANFSDNNSAGAVDADAQDIKFLITQAQTESKLQGKIDSSAGIGLIGHSDGGMIATTVGYGAGDKKDSRVTAVIAADGAQGVSDAGPPLLLMHGDQDTGNTGSVQGAYDASKAAYSALALFKGADHFHYITGAARGDNVSSYDKFHPAVDSVTKAFLARMLKKDTSAATKLSDIINATYKDTINFTDKGNDTVTGGAAATVATPVPASASCSCPGPSGGDPSLTGENAKDAFFFFIKQGFSPEQSAGIVGNFQVESSPKLDPKADNGSHRGIAQWDTKPDGRYAGLVKFAAAKSPPGDPETLGVQLEYVMDELGRQWKPAAEDLKKQTTTAGASDSWLKFFEGAVGQMDKERRDFAAKILIDYGSAAPTSSNTSSGVTCAASGATGQVVGGFSLPLDKKWYDEHKVWFTKPHHDRPAADIPVPDGTPVFSMTAGKIIAAPNEGGFGHGVTIDAGNGVMIFYGHGSDGGQIAGAKQGDTVTAGQLIMHSSYTGHVIPAGPGGAHLHLEIQLNGTRHCPQSLFVAIAENTAIPAIGDLPTSGCTN